MLFIAAERRRRNRQQADLIEAVARGYAGAKADSRDLEKHLAQLRR